MNASRTEQLKDSLAECEARSLAQIADGAPLSAILEQHLRAVEAQSPGLLASILVLDPEGRRLLHGAAPSLPSEYNAAIHGIEIGPGVGSCGTAAYLGHPVYVTDIASDPLWANFKHLAAEHGLRACWSTPVQDAGGKVLGTFATYYRNPRSPTPDELDSIRMISATVAKAIARHPGGPAAA